MSTTIDTSAPSLRSAPLPGPIADKLRALRRRIAVWIAVDGVSRLLLCALLLVGMSLALDWKFSIERAPRAVLLGLAFVALAFVAYRWLLRPLSRRPSDDALCLLVERRYRQLGDGLISAVQLARDTEWQSRGTSAALVAATIERGTAAAAAVPFPAVLRGRRFLVNLLLTAVLAAGLIAVAASVARTETMSIWFDRNVLLVERSWPQDFYLTFDGAAEGVIHVPRAEPWPLVVSVRLARRDVVPPEEVAYELRGGVDAHGDRMERGDGGKRFTCKLPAIDGPSELRAVAKGGTTAWMRVIPIDRPVVNSLALSVTPPKYAGAKQEPLAEGRGPYAILPGSRVHVHGVANKPLAQAALTLSAQRREMAAQAKHDFNFEFVYQADAAGVYSIELTDTERLPLPGQQGVGPLTSRVPFQFTLRTRTDRLPTVKLTLTGVSGIITARARLPLTLAVDDDFAVASAQINCRLRSAAEQDRGKTEVIRPADLARQLGGDKIRLNHVLDVASLHVSPGTEITLEAEAADNNDISPPRTGKSGATVLRVVSDDEFLGELLRREKEQRQEVERVQKVQIGVRADTKELARGGTNGKSGGAAADQNLVRVVREQKGVGTALRTVSKRIDDLLLEAANNRLEEQSGRFADRLRERVRTPLLVIADTSVPQVVARLEEARRVSAQAAQREEVLAAAQTGQAQIEAQLAEVLKHMIKAEDFQIVLSLLMEIQQGQSDVLTRAEKQRLEQIKKILGGGSSPPPEKQPQEPDHAMP